MARRSLIWHLFASHLFVVLASLLAALGYTTQTVRQFYLDQTISDLEARATLLSNNVREGLVSGDLDALQALCRELGNAADTRITIVLPDGRVVADSNEAPAAMDNHARRPEIQRAISGETGHANRFSQTLQQRMMYVAIPLEYAGSTVCVIRVAIPITVIQDALWVLIARIVYAGAVVAVLAAIVSWVVSRRITSPLAELQTVAERIARDDLSYLPKPRHSLEIASLGEAMNAMATKLDLRLQTAERRKNEREAILASMIEGVVAVDEDESIIMMNGSAAEIFGLDAEQSLGRGLSEVIRISAFQEFARETLESTRSIERQIALQHPEERIYRAHGSRLKAASGADAGAVIVLNDVTQLRRLERIRQDFVSNVSHELRTPITSIKGFVETLLDSAPSDPKEVRRFLRIIAKHADQLNTLIHDLLTLSHIEQGNLDALELLKTENIAEIIDESIQLCAPLAEGKRVKLVSNCDASLEARVNSSLLQQAIVNLIDNAIKYSDLENKVEISAGKENGEISIAVTDHGCGIAPQHLPRLFERFYRVDKARSRELGGTGLGLAIVKHIVELHGGRVELESHLGVGSTFTLHLPQAFDANTD